MRNSSENSDLIIIEKIRRGNISAFRDLVEKYKDVSFSLARSILHNEQSAEDALQESFIKVFRKLHKFRGQSSFSTWLYRIVVNTSLSHAKKRQRIYEEIDPESIPDMEVPDVITGLDLLKDQERKEMISRAMQSMKTDEALLLQLYYLSELDIKEIKKVTGYNESKIKVTLHRARKSIKNKLQLLLGEELVLIK